MQRRVAVFKPRPKGMHQQLSLFVIALRKGTAIPSGLCLDWKSLDTFWVGNCWDGLVYYAINVAL